MDERRRAVDSTAERRSHVGAKLYAQIKRHGKPFARLEAALVRGDGNRSVEYSYSAFVAPDEDTNSGATGVGRVTVTPVPGLDVRVSGRYGYRGRRSKSIRPFICRSETTRPRSDRCSTG